MLQLKGNSYFSTISEMEFNDIRHAKASDEVSSIWGQIVDWFCGTQKEAAK